MRGVTSEETAPSEYFSRNKSSLPYNNECKIFRPSYLEKDFD